MRLAPLLEALTPPASPLERERQARVIRPVYWIGLALTSSVLLVQILSFPPSEYHRAYPAAATIAAMLLCYPFIHARREHSAAVIILLASAAINFGNMWTGGGVQAPASRTYEVLIVAAGLVLGPGLVLPMAAIGVAAYALSLLGQSRGWIPGPANLSDNTVQTLTGIGLMVATATVVYFAARALRERAVLTESVVRALPGVIYIFNLRDNHSRWLNRSLVGPLGWDAGEPWETVLARAMHPDDLARIPLQLAQWQDVADGQIVHEEFRVADRGGRWHHFESHNAVYSRDALGAVVEFIGYIEEVTEKRRFEENLVRSERLQALSQLAGGIAHDFNNVLAPIMGHAELIREGLPETDGRAVAAGSIQRLVERARGLTRRMLGLDQHTYMELVPVDLGEVLQGFLPLLQRSLRHDLSLDFRPAAVPLTVRADPSLVERLVLNLAMNAQDAVPPQSRLQVGLDGDGGFAVLHFVDFGPGMTREVRDRAFEPFFTTKQPGQGTGLGLSSVHAIMQQHGGRVELDTELGKGCHFRLYFPLHDLDRPDPAPPRAAAWPGTVLLVDDEEDLRVVLRRMLEQLGWKVVEASSAASALSAAEGRTFELLLTDVRLPGMRGPELAAALRRRLPGLACAYMTGFSDGQVDGPLLNKPFDLAELRELLERLGAAANA